MTWRLEQRCSMGHQSTHRPRVAPALRLALDGQWGVDRVE